MKRSCAWLRILFSELRDKENEVIADISGYVPEVRDSHIRPGRMTSSLHRRVLSFRRPNQFFVYSWRKVWNDSSADTELPLKRWSTGGA
jgi:hypothetical protein